MVKKYTSTKPVNELVEYMDTLVRYVFYRLKKTYDKHDTVYYPAYYLYKENIDEFNDFKHLDEGYDAVTITIRKINNSSSIVIVKMEDISKNDWRYEMLHETYKKANAAIEKSINSFEYGKKVRAEKK